ncbi:hypothetical protein HK104_008563 [Borealophlyctis nickersoniae]|nr:hypothetical protein HK104_008563 [Borealophlyctis nickersoniae]
MQAYRYPSTTACIRTTYSTEGLAGFFRGIFPVIASVSVLRCISFSLYNGGKQEILGFLDGRGGTPLENLMIASAASGMFAGSVVATLNSPIDFIKIQKQLEKIMATTRPQPAAVELASVVASPAAAAGLGEGAGAPSRTTTAPRAAHLKATHGSVPTTPVPASMTPFKPMSTWGWAKRIVELKGLPGLYSGYGAYLLRDVLGTGMYFCGYETCKFLLTPEGGKAGPMIHMLGGGMAGTLSWIVLFPIDITKSVLQREALRPNPKYANAYAFVRARWAKAGIRGFYSGISAQLVRSFPVHALNFLVYEHVMEFCKGLGLSSSSSSSSSTSL